MNSGLPPAPVPGVTAVVSTYNRAAYIGEAVDSLLAQTLAPQRVLVVMDGCTDDTPAVLARFGSRIDVISRPNGGKAQALNAALPLVKTEFCWFFDDDDAAYPDALEKLLAPLRADPNLAFSFGHYDAARTTGNLQEAELRKNGFPYADESSAQLRLRLLRFSAFQLCAALVRTQTIRQVGGFDERLHRSQDYDLLIRLALAGDFAYCGSPVLIVRQHAGLRGSSMSPHAAADRERAWERYDAMIGERLRPLLRADRLFEHLAAETPSPGHRRRAHLLGCAWIMATKQGVAETAAAIVAALAADPSTPFTRAEAEWLREMWHSYHLSYKSPGSVKLLMRLSSSRGGRRALLSMARGAYWTSASASSRSRRAQWFLAAAAMYVASRVRVSR
jgi:glycosyltransferase involved in cell wall biosynthesis